MKREYGGLSHWLLYALGLAIAILWVIICIHSEMDRTGDLVLSRFFVGNAISVWVFLGVGVALFITAGGLLLVLVRFLEDERTFAYRDKAKAKKLNTITVVLGLLLFTALIAMILGAVAVLMSSGSDAGKPGTLYYYYYS